MMTPKTTPQGQHLMTVLLVDDSLAILTIFGELLSPFYNVRMAISGQRALEIVDTDPVPDIILLDVMMPQMDGYGVLKALRDNPKHRDIPVMFVTSIDENENEEIGLALGAVDFIHKPIKPALLLARIRTFLTFMAERNALVHEVGFLHGEITRLAQENSELRRFSIHAMKALEMGTMPPIDDLSPEALPDPIEAHGGDTFPVPLEAGAGNAH